MKNITHFLSLMNIVRTFACISIVEGHFINYIKNISNLADVNILEKMLVKLLLGMVMVFFILSGFGLTFSYYKFGIKYYKYWYLKRFKKLIPAYWIVVILFYFVLKNINGYYPIIAFNYSYYDLSMYLLLLRNFTRESWYMFEHLWFIPVILSFYVIYPFLIIILKKIGAGKFFLFSIIISFAAIEFTVANGHSVMRQNSNLLFYIPLFVFGMTLGYISYHRQDLLNVLYRPHIFFVGMIFLVISAILQGEILNNFNDMLTGIGSFLILTAFLHWIEPYIPSKTYCFFSDISKYSYLVYLIHFPLVLYFLNPLFRQYQINMNIFFLSALGIIFCTIMFYLVKIIDDLNKLLMMRINKLNY